METIKLNFDGGIATIKQGNRVLAQVFDRVEFLKNRNLGKFDTDKFPYAVTTKRGGWVTCRTLEAALDLVKEYTGITVKS